jgi:spermidine synthase
VTAGIAVVALATNPPEVIRAIARGYDPDLLIPHVVQNKHGIVHMVQSAESGDITYGGNVYDGRINVDMKINSNQLDRAYLLGILHPNPRRVLIVGLSTGAWTKVILGIPGVEVVDVVEINPAYLDLIRLYPQVASILADPRVNIHIDDGRRWLRANPQERYDLVFQNTTWHWRAYTSMLLSVDYFRQLQGHLNKGGIIAANTTGSADVFRTAAEVFPHVARYRKFAYMSEAPLLRRSDSESLLRKILIDQEPAFPDELFAPDRIGHYLLTTSLEPAEQLLSNTRAGAMARVITDQNLLTEFRHGHRPLYGWLDRILPPAPGKQGTR